MANNYVYRLSFGSQMVFLFLVSVVLALCGTILIMTATFQHATLQSAWAEIVLGSAALLVAGSILGAANHMRMIELDTIGAHLIGSHSDAWR